MFAPSLLEQAKRHAMERFPRESCGVIVAQNDGSQAYLPLPNSAPRADAFFVNPEIWLELERAPGSILALLHSHVHMDGRLPVPDYPSAADMAAQQATDLPWGILVATAGGCFPEVTWFGDACPIPPLEGPGRPFRHGVTDCYALIRDYYRVELGIALREFPRDWDWWNSGGDLYMEGLAREHFSPVGLADARPGDMMLVSVGSTARRAKVINHGGIYLGGRDHLVLHHLAGTQPTDATRFVRKEPGERWLRLQPLFFRHKERT